MASVENLQTISAEYPFESHFIEVNGSKLHYLDEGKGDPILFLHGLGTWSYLWRNIIPYVCGLGRCIAPDLIGFGKSDKPDIEYRFFDHIQYIDSFIEQLDLQNITLVMEDWGARLGLHYGRLHEENVKGIAFFEFEVGPHPDWDDLSDVLRQFFTPLRGPDAWELVVNQNVLMEQILPHTTVRPFTEEALNRYREPFKEPWTRKPLWRLPREVVIGGEPADVYAELVLEDEWFQHSDIPKLLFYATPGMVLPASKATYCEQHLRNLTTVHIGPGIHLLPEDNPQMIGTELAKWLQTSLNF